MTRSWRRASSAMLLFCATPLAAQRSERRVIDRAAIAAAGWHRLGDIAAALPPGTTASIEGFNHELRGSRVGFFQTNGVTATWTVRLDGQLLPLQIGGVWILDEIPVAITQLDSIVLTEGPHLTDGRAALLGTIDLYTRRVRGASLLGDYQHGDETGDPGPYRYTSRATPNVEKIGPFTSGAAAIGNSTASLDLAARYASLNITDGRVTSRVGPIFPAYQSDVNASGGSGAATFDFLGGRTYVIGGRGRFTGFFPTAAPGINQQLRVVTTHAGLSGSLLLGRRLWRFAATGTSLDVDPLGSVAPLISDARRVIGDGFVETEIAPRLRLGIGGTTGKQETGVQNPEFTSGRAWVGYSRTRESVDFATERSASRFRYSAAARFQRAINDSDQVGLSLTRLEAWRFGDFAWMDRSASDSSGTTAAEARGELTTRSILKARPTWYARVFSYSGIGTSAVEGIAGGVIVNAPANSTITARLRAEVTQLLGDAGTGESSTPGGYIEGDASTRTAGGFHLSLGGRYAPRTHWSGSADDVPSTRRVDFSVNKALWRDRIRAQIVMRNLLNVDDRTHPDGAQWNLRTHLAVTVALPSGPGSQ